MSQAPRSPPPPTSWTSGLLEVAYVTDVGLVRPSNQDNLYVAEPSRVSDPAGLLVAVADGMGGHQGGEVASSHVREALESYYKAVGPDSVEKDFKKLVTEANKTLSRKSRQDPDLTGMGTTLTAAVIQGEKSVTVFQVGDSRAYRRRHDELSQLTQDHSLVNEELKKGTITPEEAKNHPKRNVITRAVGTRPILDVDTYRVDLEPDDDLLLCSDGLHGYVPEEKIADILKRGLPADRTVEELLALAYEAGGHDNVAIVLVRLREKLPWFRRIFRSLWPLR
ncbi:MAG: Stp1/IreP family PP2C-type Ser/Thr phosphatase [Candidatus Riflebacteria bacterium]|nr:Stp1/IreP family PP2C-type Ser/Thr phosphatase [Candidatus Riflebacteria bacterium]